ncbi:glucokinase [Acuticoccus sp. I52.16.1]|uniref:glucokinase n=1 Tax=Acuticoccus sp. I52.16.1 TaxID=2928472 RepID=UPI001FD29A7E|nr:glucokinase [Acuticoccus sp. I52.16.1]UOM35122.1 glucokinase [Acuticoccus sp. I52.16.1]
MKTPRRRAGDLRPLSFPVLIADIGGTNVRLAVLPEAHSPVRDFPTVQTSAFPDFASAAEATVLDATAIMPRSCLIAAAGPITGAHVKLTNADWEIDPVALCRQLNLDTVITFNDFEALALSLPYLHGEQLLQVGAGETVPRAPRVVIGPGTGLGVAVMVYGDKRYTPLAGEGGHVSLAPETDRDFQIWPHIDRLHGRISGETLLSGRGLARIYRAIARADGKDPWCTEGSEVTHALGYDDVIAAEAIDLFLTYLGRMAGDLALVTLAKGGVYIGGGIVPRLADRIASSGFRAAFEAKAPHAAIMRDIPTYLITEPKPAVSGMASFATLPERFALDLSERRFGPNGLVP